MNWKRRQRRSSRIVRSRNEIGTRQKAWKAASELQATLRKTCRLQAGAASSWRNINAIGAATGHLELPFQNIAVATWRIGCGKQTASASERPRWPKISVICKSEEANARIKCLKRKITAQTLISRQQTDVLFGCANSVDSMLADVRNRCSSLR